MKRCPECRKDYLDDSLLYCLDDGSLLVQGVVDEPQTAILHQTTAPGEAPTRAQIYTTEQTAVLRGAAEAEPQKGFGDLSEKPSFSANRAAKLLAALVVAVLILIGGFFGYRYFAPAKQIESIAVMPFVNESGNADVEYLSDGMTETLIKSLTNVPNLNVKPRSTVFRYKGKDINLQTIGSELKVQAILNGRVAQRGDQVMLSLELVDVRQDTVIWTEQYQRKQSDLVSLQSEIAKDVSSHIQRKLSGADEAKVAKTGTVDPQAYQAYLKGRYYWNRRTATNLGKALEEFKTATDRDPNYAVAFVGLADCYTLLTEYAGASSSETLPKAKTYATRAIALDPQLAEAHASLGLIAHNSYEWAESEKEFKLAIEANPSYPTTYHWYSILLRSLGRFEEAEAMIKRAQELDPVSSVIAVNVSRTYQIRRDDAAAIGNSLKLIEIDPNFPAVHEYLAFSYLRTGRTAEAVAASERGVELSNRSGIAVGDLGFVYASVGRTDDARALIKELEAKYAKKEALGMFIAGIYAALKDRDKAFEWLEKDFDARSGQLGTFRWMFQFDSIRDDPRYKDLLGRMNLPE